APSDRRAPARLDAAARSVDPRGDEPMMSRRSNGGFEEMEALIYRLFAEKQFALALLALVMVAQLLSAQFLLLRLRPPSAQAVAAPTAQQRVDVRCEAGGARTLSGEAMSREGA